jgi:hypothetical protein
MFAYGVAAATDQETVPLFTSDDLDRMFGPAPRGPSELVDKSQPGDWNTVERFIDREYARIDADRQHSLNSRELDRSAVREDDSSRIYGSMLWGAGYYGGWGNGVYGPVRGSRGYDDRGVAYRAAYARATGQGVRAGDRGGMNRGGGARGGGMHGGGGHGGGRRK